MCKYVIIIISTGVFYSSFMDNVGPIMSNREKARGVSAKEVLKEALSSTGKRL